MTTVKAYKTRDGRIFEKKEDAEKAEVWLELVEVLESNVDWNETGSQQIADVILANFKYVNFRTT